MPLLDLRAESRRHRPALPSLDGRARRMLDASARATWHGRMVNEHGSAVVFEGLARQLARGGFAASEVKCAEQFAAEERRHGVLCGAVVEALGGEALADVAAPDEFPLHDDVPAREAVVRNLLSVSCMSETVAVSLIGAEREEMPEGSLRDLLTTIWADEIGHARFGWRLVSEVAPTLDDEMRERLGEYLRVAFAHLEEHELAHLPLSSAPPAEGACLGLCSGSDARVLFYDTVETVIVAALEKLGLPARRAWETRHERNEKSVAA